jgi:hypothetical protein
MNLSSRGLFFNLLVGLPGGFLIIMGMFMFNSLLGMLFPTGPIVMLALLSFAALVVGLLARLMQPFHGLLTALVAGVIAALILFYLNQAAPTEVGMRLVFGPIGYLAAIGFSILGAWVFPRLRRKPK